MAKERLTTEQKIAQTRAKLAQLEARQAAADRKADTKKKIVLGGMVLAEMREDAAFKTQIIALLNERVTRPVDRQAVAEWLSTDSQRA